MIEMRLTGRATLRASAGGEMAGPNIALNGEKSGNGAALTGRKARTAPRDGPVVRD